MEIINSFKKYLMATVPKIVVKDGNLAELNETMESRKAGDIYVAASLKIDTFDSYLSFSPDVLYAAGIVDSWEISRMVKDKYQIPTSYRNDVIIANRERIIKNYVELNDYYRMISGLPEFDQEPIQIDYETAYQYGYTEGVGDYINLHELPTNVLRYMEATGFLDNLLVQYPNHKYISYLGVRKIDIVTARRADNYALLYVPRLDNAYRFYRDFIFFYEESRNYFMTCVYNHHFASQYAYYSGFIGFMILHMTIQRMLSNLFKVIVDRDFYDLDSIRVFLESYSIPYVDLFTMNQQKMLVKNLNILLRQKSDVQVLYNILELLGYTDFELIKYLLVKQHILTQDDDESLPVPIFVYKTVIDDSGNNVLELDRSSMYEYYFYGIKMDENDVVLSDILDVNSHEYDEFVLGDETWIQDNDLVSRLEEMQMNYIETKYADISITFRMHEITFELVYLTRLILDGKYRTEFIPIEIPLISETPTNLFDLWILLICLICKRNGMEPDIMNTPSKILYILGFNFNEDLNKIRQEIEAKPTLYSQKLLKYIQKVEMYTTSDVNTMYRNVKELSEFLIEAMQITDDPDIYHTYKKLYNTLLLTQYNKELYTMDNMEVANRFDEYLKVNSPMLYDFYIGLESKDDCIDFVNYIATKMTGMLEDTEYLSHLNPIDTKIINGILTILRAFKSFTIDIKGINVLYMFDSRLDNLMKLMDKACIKVNIKTHDMAFQFSDVLHRFKNSVQYNEFISKLKDLCELRGCIHPRDYYDMLDKSLSSYIHCIVKDAMGNSIGDTFSVSIGVRSCSRSNMKDTCEIHWVNPGESL